MPQLLRDILEHAIRQHGTFDVGNANLDAVQIEPKAVIVATVEPHETRIDAIRAMWPNTTILQIEAQTGAAFLYAPRLSAIALGQQRAGDLLDALCRAMSK